MVTRDDVARRAGVSTAVVSYVVNDGPRSVAPETRDRVLAAIAELGYRPNVAARALKTGRMRTFALLVPDNRNPYFAELAHAIEDVAFRAGYALLVANSNNDPEREAAQLAAIRDRQVDGVFLIPTGQPDPSLVPAVPVVVLDRIDAATTFSSVAVDNPAGAAAGTRHLVEVHGHTRVACLAGPDGVPVAVEREAGWRSALREAGLPTDGLVHRSAFSREGGYRAGLDLLASRQRPTAVFASSDVQAIGLLRAAHEAGIAVPDDLAVVAFDGTRESEFTAPPLAVVRQRLDRIAAVALELMGAGGVRREVVDFDFVARASCGCASADSAGV
jgi:LacI family transcriptional regulator